MPLECSRDSSSNVRQGEDQVHAPLRANSMGANTCRSITSRLLFCSGASVCTDSIKGGWAGGHGRMKLLQIPELFLDNLLVKLKFKRKWNAKNSDDKGRGGGGQIHSLRQNRNNDLPDFLFLYSSCFEVHEHCQGVSPMAKSSHIEKKIMNSQECLGHYTTRTH